MSVIAVDNTIIIVLIREGRTVPSHPAETEAENRVLRAGSRTIPGSADILREFRGYSRAGTRRFFRVENSMLLEIGRDGQLLALKEQKPNVQESVKGKGGVMSGLHIPWPYLVYWPGGYLQVREV